MLKKVMLKNEYRAAREKVFPTDVSLAWYIRTRKEGLTAEGALLMIAGRWFIDPDVFDAFVVSHGLNDAKNHRRGSRGVE